MERHHERFVLDVLRSFLRFRIAVLVIAAFTGYEIRGCNLEGDARTAIRDGSASAEFHSERPHANDSAGVGGNIRE